MISGLRAITALLASLSGEAAVDYGVFPVLDRENKIEGTAFLIDKKHGYLLSAAHVVVKCGAAGIDEEIAVRWSMPVRDGSVGLLFPRNVILRIADAGYDLKCKSEINTVKDWVLLQVKNRDDYKLFTPYREIPISESLDLRKLTELANNESQIKVIGYPRKNPISRPKRGRLVPNESGDGLWQVEVRVNDGNSGGPCVAGNTNDNTLLGIVIKKHNGDPSYSSFIPMYSVAIKVATNGRIPKTTSVERVITLLEKISRLSGDQLDARNLLKNPFREPVFDLLLLIHTLSGLEYYQLANHLCQNQDLRDVATPIVLRHFDRVSGRQLVKSIYCDPDSVGSAIKHVNSFATEWRIDNPGSTYNRPAAFYSEVGNLVVKHYDRVNAGVDDEDLSRFLLEFAVVESSSTGGLPNARWAIAQARKKNPTPSHWRYAAGIVMSDLKPDERLSLLSSKIGKRVKSSDDNRIYIHQADVIPETWRVVIKESASSKMWKTFHHKAGVQKIEWARLTSGKFISSAEVAAMKSLADHGFGFE